MHYEYPEGWFAIATSAKIKPGTVANSRAFGRDFVVFRTESGKLGVFDSHCPNCGIELAYKGRVIGEYLQCSFHGTKYTNDGYPVADGRKDSLQAARSWNVTEVQDLIFLWYSAHNDKPKWHLDIQSEQIAKEWELPNLYSMADIYSTLEVVRQDFSDLAHYSHVHNVNRPQTNIQISDYKFLFQSYFDHQKSKWLGPLHRLRLQVDGTLYGLGYLTNVSELWLGNYKQSLVRYYMEQAMTQIDENHIRVYARFGAAKLVNWAYRLFTIYIGKNIVNTGAHEDQQYWARRRFTEAEFKDDEFLMLYAQWLKLFQPSTKLYTGSKEELANIMH